ncbi:hypothetical protein CVT24_003396 [Panaeolus cyanescens]|uniref:NAD(P)-binding protein n=1 Tax=Panaeolus cyanescens TaxID=181874 RepID=A0A409Y703_9AGAR|nr:hypothetical protein CVT24_003396 [Panaeolus cyanescens]
MTLLDANTHPMTLPSFSMAGKVCVVTGAARGLGLEFCRAFIQSYGLHQDMLIFVELNVFQRGCTSLAILDIKQSETDETADELTAYCQELHKVVPKSVKIIGLECDVTIESSVKSAFIVIMEQFGKIDAVVANAGIVHNYTALDYPADKMSRLFDVNVHGAFYTAREAARNMIPLGGGSIILIASMSANIVNIPQFQTPYNASKAAVKHMAASLAVEWAKSGVRVNALSPGYMLTKLTKTVLENDSALKKTWESLTPMGRMGEAEDLSGAIVFLASDASKFMTGSEIRVDGGYCAV